MGKSQKCKTSPLGTPDRLIQMLKLFEQIQILSEPRSEGKEGMEIGIPTK
jgi:hypothetical protein